MINSVKLSVALCTYNGEKYISKQLESIFNQTIKVSEVIIYDDKSSDNTVLIINTFIEKYSDVIALYTNETNLGSSKNFENAISKCNGDYIFLSDQDDIWKKDKVEKTLNIFSKNINAEGVFSNADFIDENDNLILQSVSLWDYVSFFEGKNHDAKNLYRLISHRGNYLTGATLCIKKEVVSRSIPFQTGIDFIHDEWLGFILAKRETLYYSTEKLISYRIHVDQQLGIGKMQKKQNVKDENYQKYNLISLKIQPKRFKDFKFLSRCYFFQYDKYKNLFSHHNNHDFNNLSLEMKELYIKTDLIMKTKFPVQTFLLNLNDKFRGKRQL